jgi:hypothetical protein
MNVSSSNSEKDVYDKLINSLKEEINFLREIVKKLN